MTPLHLVFVYDGAAHLRDDFHGMVFMSALALLFIVGGAAEGWSRGRAGGGLGHFLLLCLVSVVPFYVAYKFHDQMNDDGKRDAQIAGGAFSIAVGRIEKIRLTFQKTTDRVSFVLDGIAFDSPFSDQKCHMIAGSLARVSYSRAPSGWPEVLRMELETPCPPRMK